MSTSLEARAWIEVRADALRKNLDRIRGVVGSETRVLPMVKANAYGLGVGELVRVLDPSAPWGYGVATAAEGIELRELGVSRPVVVCSPLPLGEVEGAVAHRLQLSISSIEALEAVAAAARELRTTAKVHVDVDTGMGRSGFDWRTASQWLPLVADHVVQDIEWVGCYTHLHSADEAMESVQEQWGRLRDVLDQIVSPPEGLLIHVLNSAGVFRAPDYANAVVRPGIFLYGGEIGEGQPRPLPVAAIRARVVHVRDVVEGTTLGYGSTYVAGGAERWATLAIGYGDGLPRALGNRGRALLRGASVPIIGRISMDVTVVNITDLPDLELGDVGTLLGPDGDQEITLDEVALQAGTISYEILTGLTRRLPRIWTEVRG